MTLNSLWSSGNLRWACISTSDPLYKVKSFHTSPLSLNWTSYFKPAINLWTEGAQESSCLSQETEEHEVRHRGLSGSHGSDDEQICNAPRPHKVTVSESVPPLEHDRKRAASVWQGRCGRLSREKKKKKKKKRSEERRVGKECRSLMSCYL